jgi:hypothetical protein
MCGRRTWSGRCAGWHRAAEVIRLGMRQGPSANDAPTVALLGGFFHPQASFALQLFQFGIEFLDVLGVHAVDEEDALDVVEFVLDDAGEQAGGFEDMREALHVLVAQADGDGADDVAAYFGEGEAAFVNTVGWAGQVFDLGVGDGEGEEEGGGDGFAVEVGVGGLGGAVLEVGNEEVEGAADLLGGEADAFLGEHGFVHVAGEGGEGAVEGLDGSAAFAQDGVAVMGNGQGHGEKGGATFS